MLKNIFSWYFSKNALPYWIILIADSIICYLSGLLVFWLLYKGNILNARFVIITQTMGMLMLINIVSFKFFHTYYGIIRYSSFIDLMKVAKAMLVAFAVAIIVQLILIIPNPGIFHDVLLPLRFRHLILIYLIATIGIWAMRILVKTVYDVTVSNNSGMPTLVYGIKDGGISLAKNIRSTQKSRFKLSGFIAHEDNFHNKILMGVKVYNVDKELIDVIKLRNIKAVLVSPIQNERFRHDEKLQDILLSTGVRVYMMRTQTQAIDDAKDFSASLLKEIKIEDLLPRDQINVDIEKIGESLKDKRVLITGSAGSIGSEILRQVCTFAPAELILIDLAETPQHSISLVINEQYPDIKKHTLVGSICNKERMENVFSKYRPDYVFHAAAYKHVPMMEDNPSESVQNNILGTKVIADLSVKYGVKKFVMLSTDKAVNPTNVMGCSKRICEIYVQSLNSVADTQFVTTRFGNVLGSNGSVIPLFEKQIKEGGPITVTDPNIIRYFMLISEACKLVLEAGTNGKGGEIFVFDMGKPVRIADLAQRMIWLSGAENVEIKYTGLRPGEKLYEEVLSDEENTVPSFHEKIRIAKVREYDYNNVSASIDELIDIAKTYDTMAIVKKMKEIVPEFISNNSPYSVLDK